jgi:hypothetical protein
MGTAHTIARHLPGAPAWSRGAPRPYPLGWASGSRVALARGRRGGGRRPRSLVLCEPRGRSGAQAPPTDHDREAARSAESHRASGRALVGGFRRGEFRKRSPTPRELPSSVRPARPRHTHVTPRDTRATPSSPRRRPPRPGDALLDPADLPTAPDSPPGGSAARHGRRALDRPPSSRVDRRPAGRGSTHAHAGPIRSPPARPPRPRAARRLPALEDER